MLTRPVQAALSFSLHAVQLDLQGRIVQEGMLLYNLSKDHRVAFEVLTRKKYFDFQPVAKRLQQAYSDRLRKKGFSSGQSKQD